MAQQFETKLKQDFGAEIARRETELKKLRKVAAELVPRRGRRKKK